LQHAYLVGFTDEEQAALGEAYDAAKVFASFAPSDLLKVASHPYAGFDTCTPMGQLLWRSVRQQSYYARPEHTAIGARIAASAATIGGAC